MDAFHPIAAAEKTSLRLCVERNEVADSCRKSLLSFFTDVAPGGNARALAAWLVGSYAHAVLPTTRFDFPSGRVSRGQLTDLIDDARAEVALTMRSLTSAEVGMHFAMHAANSGWVVQFTDLRGHVGFVPIDLPRMRLRERILSLMAADYLARSSSYAHDLEVCETCDLPNFCAEEGERSCKLCDRKSGVDFKGATVTPIKHTRVA